MFLSTLKLGLCFLLIISFPLYELDQKFQTLDYTFFKKVYIVSYTKSYL